MNAKAFLDTNILVYLFDRHEPTKRRRAQEVFSKLAQAGAVVVSTQALQEFYVTVTRKLKPPLPPSEAREILESLLEMTIIQVDPAMILRAVETSQDHQVSLWDAIILHSAHQAQCTTLLTEHLHHGWQWQGLRVENPFRAEA
ncbi:MAG: PIN domain-containing protein [Deltaproteobacteria bacterium]|nr:PIN domain-containing protein [Deltaproteobacteria bacterium]